MFFSSRDKHITKGHYMNYTDDEVKDFYKKYIAKGNMNKGKKGKNNIVLHRCRSFYNDSTHQRVYEPFQVPDGTWFTIPPIYEEREGYLIRNRPEYKN